MVIFSRLSLIAIFIFDRIIKWWVLYTVRCEGEKVFPTFSLTLFDHKFSGSIVYVTNAGAAWGFLSDYPQLLNAFRICTIAAIFLGLRLEQGLSAMARYLWMTIAIAAMSNLCDVFFYGHIIDMLLFQVDYWSFAAFNIADATICFGWCGLFLLHFQGSNAKCRVR